MKAEDAWRTWMGVTDTGIDPRPMPGAMIAAFHEVFMAGYASAELERIDDRICDLIAGQDVPKVNDEIQVEYLYYILEIIRGEKVRR